MLPVLQETRLGKSVVHVRALTYCDIHTINVDDLLKVLEFHKPFAITFSRNLCLTFDLSKRVVFSKVNICEKKYLTTTPATTLFRYDNFN